MKCTKANLGFGNNVCEWGTHIAGLYESDEERDFIIMNFLKQGIRDLNFQIYSCFERTSDEFKDSFIKNYDITKAEVENDALFRIVPAKDLYYANGEFSPFKMIDSLKIFYSDMQKDSDKGIRATAEMTWVKNCIIGIEGFMLYESMLNNFIKGRKWISICMYNINKFSGKMIMEALRTHPYSICSGVLMENPYYVDPDLWLMNNASSLYKVEMMNVNGN